MGIAVVPVDNNTVDLVGLDLGSPNLFSTNLRQSMRDGTLSAISGHDDITWKVFKDTTVTPPNTIGAFGNEIIIPYIVGGPPSTVVAQIRIIYHYELAFPSTTAFNSLATKTSQANPKAIEGANFVQRTLGSVVKGGTEEVEKKVMTAAQNFGRNLARLGGAALGYAFGGPVGASAGYQGTGMIMDMVD